MKCSQCENEAFFTVGEEDKQAPLCIDHYTKFFNVIKQRDIMLKQEMNWLEDYMQYTIGLSPSPPRYDVTQVHSTINTGDVVLNNISVDRSVIGVVNTGNVEKIDSAITIMKESGEEELSVAIQSLSEAVLTNQEADSEVKKEILDILSVLSSQAVMPTDSRNSSAMQILIKRLGNLVNSIKTLGGIWDTVSQFIENAF